MRRIARVDRNQAEIVAALRAAGATVQPLHAVGQGCPDLLVGFRGFNLLVEVKDGAKSLSRRSLTDRQTAWHGGWKGTVAVVEDAPAALAVLGLIGTGGAD